MPDTVHALARNGAALTSIDRPVWFAGAAILSSLNIRAAPILTSIEEQGWLNATLNLFTLSAVVWFAFYALWRIAETSREPEPMSRGDKAVAGALVMAALLPFAIVTAVLQLVAAVWLSGRSNAGTDSRRIGLIMLAISCNLLIGPSLLMVFSEALLRADSIFVAWLSGSRAVGNLVQFANGEWFIVGRSCSSLGNISLGILFWMTAVQLFRLTITGRLLGFLALSVGAMFLTNTARLTAIALYPADFVWLHEGAGNDMFGWAALVLLAAIAAWGVLDATRRPAT